MKFAGPFTQLQWLQNIQAINNVSGLIVLEVKSLNSNPNINSSHAQDQLETTI